MLTLALTIAVIALAMLFMAVGLIVRGRRLRGSCGGAGPGCHCETAGVPVEERACERLRGPGATLR